MTPRAAPPKRSAPAERGCCVASRALRPSGLRAYPVHRVGQILGEILHLELRLGTLGGDPIAEHGQAERTGGRHPRRLRPECLLDAFVVNALADLLLPPPPAAAGATAKATLVMALDLDELGARDGLDDRPWRVVDVIPAAEVAGVVVRELPVDRLAGLEPAIFDQAGQQLRVMDDLIGAAKLGELVLDGVEAVRTGGDHLPHLPPVHGFDVLLRLGLIEVLVADAARRVAVTGL